MHVSSKRGVKNVVVMLRCGAGLWPGSVSWLVGLEGGASGWGFLGLVLGFWKVWRFGSRWFLVSRLR